MAKSEPLLWWAGTGRWKNCSVVVSEEGSQAVWQEIRLKNMSVSCVLL